MDGAKLFLACTALLWGFLLALFIWVLVCAFRAGGEAGRRVAVVAAASRRVPIVIPLDGEDPEEASPHPPAVCVAAVHPDGSIELAREDATR